MAKTKSLVSHNIGYSSRFFFELSNALGYTGLQKFNHFGQYLSGAFKLAWENEVRTNYAANHQRTHPGFDRALIGTWIRFMDNKICARLVSS